MYLDGNQDRDV